MVLSAVYDRKVNGLNGVRLFLALSVIFCHSFALTGAEIAWRPIRQLVTDFGVDGFFAISGFLMVASWLNRPHMPTFLLSRAARILPAFYVCLVVTAFVFAPVSMIISGAWAPGWLSSSATYVAKNTGLWIFQEGIEGTLHGQHTSEWNVSLWTLAWEFACYLCVLVLGVAGLLRKRPALIAAFVLTWMTLLVTTTGVLSSEILMTAARFALMFLAGALVYTFQSSIKLTWSRVAVAAAIVLAAATIPDYRIIAAPFVAYICIGLGALLKHPVFQLKTDISYGIYIYGFPIQQLLALAGSAWLGVLGFAVVSTIATVPLAVASCRLVERPALRWKDGALTSIGQRKAPVYSRK